MPRDVALVRSLRAFTERSAADFTAVESDLNRQLSGRDTYAIWGFGEMTMKLLALAPLRARRLVGLIDSNPSRQGFRYGDVRVQSPDAGIPDGPIVIGSLLSGAGIVGHLTELGRAEQIVRLRRP